MSSSSSSISSSSSLNSAVLGSTAFSACKSESIPMAVSVLSQRSHVPQSSSLASHDVSLAAAPKETCVFKETVEGVGPKYINEKSVTLQFIQRLITLNQGSKKPLSMEIISHLTLKEVIDLGYLKLISILTSKSHADLGVELMKKVRSLNEEDEDFQRNVQEISELAKKLAGENPAKELNSFRGTLEFLLKSKLEYRLQIAPSTQSTQENQLKIAQYFISLMDEDFVNEIAELKIFLPNVELFGVKIISSDLFNFINKWFETFSKKIVDTKEANNNEFVFKFEQLSQFVRNFNSQILPPLQKDILEHTLMLLTSVKLGFASTDTHSIVKRKMDEHRVCIAEKIAHFFESLAIDIRSLIEKNNKVEGFTGSSLYTAIAQLLVNLSYEGVKEDLQKKLSQLSKTFDGPSQKIKVENNEKPKKSNRKEKKQKKLPPLFNIRSPELIAVENELHKLFSARANELTSSFISFFKEGEYSKNLQTYVDFFSEKGLKIAISRCVQILFESTFSSRKLNQKELTLQNAIEFIQQVGEQGISEAKEDKAQSFWRYSKLMEYAFCTSLLSSFGDLDLLHGQIELSQQLDEFLGENIKLRFRILHLAKRLSGLYLPQLSAFQNSYQSSDHLSWMEWIDAEEEIIKARSKKRAVEEKSSLDEEDEVAESEKPVECVSAAHVAAATPKAEIHCDTTSFSVIVDSVKKLFSHFYGVKNLDPAQSSSKLTRSEIAQRQQIYAFDQVITLLKAMNACDSDPRVLEKLLSQFFHFGHMAIEQAATALYVQRHPNRLNIPHDINELLNDFRCHVRNRWTAQCPSTSLYYRYPFSFDQRANSPLSLRHIARPLPNTTREGVPQNLHLWVIDFTRTHLEILERSLSPNMKGEIQTFKKEFEAFAQAPFQRVLAAAGRHAPFESKALNDSIGLLNSSLNDLNQLLRTNRFPLEQRQSLENALHHLKSLSEEPYILSKLPEQEYLSIHGHRYLIAAQYFMENIGIALMYNPESTCFTHDLNAIFKNINLPDSITPEMIAYLRSLNVLKGSEYIIKYFAFLQKGGPESSTMDFMDKLYSFAKEPEGFIPNGHKGKSKESLQQKLADDIHLAARLTQALVRLTIERLQPGMPPRLSSGAAAAV